MGFHVTEGSDLSNIPANAAAGRRAVWGRTIRRNTARRPIKPDEKTSVVATADRGIPPRADSAKAGQ